MSTLRRHAGGLLRLEASRTEHPLGARCVAAPADSCGLRRERANLWQSAHPARPQRGRREGQPQAGGAADARGGITGPSRARLSPLAGQPRFLSRGSQLGTHASGVPCRSTMGRRHHLPQSPPALVLPRGGDGPAHAAHRRLEPRAPQDDPIDLTRVQPGGGQFASRSQV